MKRNEVTEIQYLNYGDHFYFLGDGKKTVWEKGGRLDGVAMYKIQAAQVYRDKTKTVDDTTKVVFLCAKEADA